MANDADKFVEFVSKIDTKKALELIFERTADKPCPFCATSSWFFEAGSHLMTSEGDPSPIFLLKDARALFGATPNVPVVALYCSNCGFVRLHHIGVVTRDK